MKLSTWHDACHAKSVQLIVEIGSSRSHSGVVFGHKKEGGSKPLGSGKEARHKRPPMMEHHLHELPGIGKSGETESRQEAGRKDRVTGGLLQLGGRELFSVS